jgi:voltage-gated potassium channel
MTWVPHGLSDQIKRGRVPVVAAGVIGLILISNPRMRAGWNAELNTLLWFCFAYFTLEWALRIRDCMRSKRPLAQLVSIEHAIDALAVVPITLAFAAGFASASVWLLGVLWLLKLEPAMAAFALLSRVAASEARPLISVGVLFFMGLIVAAVAIHVAERHAQPEAFGTLADGLYWAITTLTTTGYGDLVPITKLGRLIAGLVMICGIAVFGLWIGILATGFAQESRRVDFLRSWELVANSPFFKGLSPPEIIEIAGMLKRWDAPAGTVVIREGREGDCMYFIAAGQAEVRRKDQTFELRPPAFFGEMALLGEGVRTATVVTTSPATLLRLDRLDFRVFLARHPQLAHVIEGEAVQRAKRNVEASAHQDG